MKILLGQAIVFFILGLLQGNLLTTIYNDKKALRKGK
jgi:hypothetical protein